MLLDNLNHFSDRAVMAANITKKIMNYYETKKNRTRVEHNLNNHKMTSHVYSKLQFLHDNYWLIMISRIEKRWSPCELTTSIYKSVSLIFLAVPYKLGLLTNQLCKAQSTNNFNNKSTAQRKRSTCNLFHWCIMIQDVCVT